MYLVHLAASFLATPRVRLSRLPDVRPKFVEALGLRPRVYTLLRSSTMFFPINRQIAALK